MEKKPRTFSENVSEEKHLSINMTILFDHPVQARRLVSRPPPPLLPSTPSLFSELQWKEIERQVRGGGDFQSAALELAATTDPVFPEAMTKIL